MNLLSGLADYKWVTLIATLVLWAAFWYWRLAVMSVPEAKLLEAQPGADRYSTLDFQLYFARGFDPKKILDNWNPEARDFARSSLYLDFALMPMYALATAGLCLFAASAGGGWWRTVFLCVAVVPMGAWAFDILENVAEFGLLRTPHESAPDPDLLMVAATATCLKWGLLGISLAMGGVGFVVTGVRLICKWFAP